eukprot:352136_1
MAQKMSNTAYDWNEQPYSPTVPYATAVASQPMPVNGNGNNSPPSTVVYADAYTVPEIVYESNSKSQTTNMKTLPNTPQLNYASTQASYPPQVSYTTYQPSAVQRTPALIVDNRLRCRYCGELGPPTLVSAWPSCMAWVFFFFLLLLFWPLCWIPLVACHKKLQMSSLQSLMGSDFMIK